jgi:hypothetical protein
MPTDHEAAELRRRAAELRRLASHLAATPLDDLVRWAGPDTWLSPRAAQLRDELAVDRARLASAVDDLARHARWLERRAEAAELLATTTALVGG